tara:strand:+ start:80576 stop:81985 length:1410 start_codon:yes stop_codon:yes gene_type:complete
MIEFILNNETIQTTENAGMTLLDFIREKRALKGTKIGCREGDCGACTVLVGTLNTTNKAVYQTITSCISPLGNAHGKHIVTVEGTNLTDQLTAAQKAMSDNYATQCGFCTPGFVVSLTGLALSDRIHTYENSRDAIGGNICRCTGYKSIERATLSITKTLAKKDVSNSIGWLIDHAFIPSYFSEIPKKLTQIHSKNKHASGTDLVAGGTDLYVKHADELSEKEIHLVASDSNNNSISFYKNSCVMSGSTTVTDIMNNNALSAYFPDLKQQLKLVSSEPIRNMATLAGNFVNASPIGDMTVFFLALNSKITIKNSRDKLRTISLKDFFKSYKEYDLKKEEIITNITFDMPDSSCHFNFEKVSKRTHLDIASVNSAIHLKVTNGVIEAAAIAVGGVAPIPKFLHTTAAFLVGKSLTIETVQEANTIMQAEIAPISDVRGSSDYKRLLARQLLFAHFIKCWPKTFNLNTLLT